MKYDRREKGGLFVIQKSENQYLISVEIKELLADKLIRNVWFMSGKNDKIEAPKYIKKTQEQVMQLADINVDCEHSF